MVRSAPPVASSAPSGLNAMLSTVSDAVPNLRRSLPVAGSNAADSPCSPGVPDATASMPPSRLYASPGAALEQPGEGVQPQAASVLVDTVTGDAFGDQQRGDVVLETHGNRLGGSAVMGDRRHITDDQDGEQESKSGGGHRSVSERMIVF